MNANNRDARRQYGNNYGETVDGFFSRRGGYARMKPKELHTPVPIMWTPRQPFFGKKVDFGDPLNNPIPILDHHRAATSSGRVVRIPLTGDVENLWAGNMRQDAQWMHIVPDPTLTAGITAAAVFPEQMGGVNIEQLTGWRVLGQFA